MGALSGLVGWLIIGMLAVSNPGTPVARRAGADGGIAARLVIDSAPVFDRAPTHPFAHGGAEAPAGAAVARRLRQVW